MSFPVSRLGGLPMRYRRQSRKGIWAHGLDGLVSDLPKATNLRPIRLRAAANWLRLSSLTIHVLCFSFAGNVGAGKLRVYAAEKTRACWVSRNPPLRVLVRSQPGIGRPRRCSTGSACFWQRRCKGAETTKPKTACRTLRTFQRGTLSAVHLARQGFSLHTVRTV